MDCAAQKENGTVLFPTRALCATRALLSVRSKLAPRSLLLSGPPGVGKSIGVKAGVQAEKLTLLNVSPSDGLDKLSSILKRAGRIALSSHNAVVVYVDEIDGLCPAPVVASSEVFNATTATLSFFLKRLSCTPKAVENVYVIATTNRIDAVHPRLLGPLCFHRHIEIESPSAAERKSILLYYLPKADARVLSKIASQTSGFVVADLSLLCSTALEHHTRLKTQSNGSTSVFVPHASCILFALQNITSSISRTFSNLEIPKFSWNDIGGMSSVKERLKMAVEWPLRHEETFQRLGLKAPRGILLYGPPGCSKTSLARAAASESGVAFFSLNGADVFSCYVGEAERILRKAFRIARAAKPSILFLDEIDALVGKRSSGGDGEGNKVQERVLSTLLTEMDGIISTDGVLVLAASNRLDLLDDALIRPGRFDDILHVDLPTENERLEILEIVTKPMNVKSYVDLSRLAKCTNGYTGADLKALCVNAGLAAVRQYFSRLECTVAGSHSQTEMSDNLVLEFKKFVSSKSPE